LSTIHEHDRQTDHGTVTSIAIGEITCQLRLKRLAYKLIELKNQHAPITFTIINTQQEMRLAI